MSKFDIIGPINYKRLKEFEDFINDCDLKNITIQICSQGGDEGAGRALAGRIRGLIDAGVNVVTVGYGDIHSAAVVVFAAGQERLLSHAAVVMVHESSVEADTLNASGYKRLAKQMEADEQFWCKLLERYTGTDAKVWAKLHADETYLTPEQALELKLATTII